MRNILFILLLLFQLPFEAQAQTVIKMKREGGVSIIPCKVNGLNLNFIFDTGASDVSISLTEASFMLKNGYLEKNDIIGTSNYVDATGKLSEGVNIILKEIEIAGLKLYNVKASIITTIKAPLLLGQSTISKLGKIEIDLKQNTITVLTGKGTYDYSKNYQNKAQGVDTANGGNKTLNSESEYLQRGLSKSERQDHDGAIKDFNKAIEFNPNSAYAYYLRGAEKLALQDFKGAISDYSKSIDINPNHDESYFCRGVIKHFLAEYQGAIADLSKAIEINPQKSRFYLSRGETKNELEDYRGALADLTKAIELNPNEERAFCKRGVSKLYLEDYRGAMNDLNKAIEVLPDDDDAYYWRGILKNDLEDYRGAITDFTKSIEINPKYARAYLNRGFAKGYLGQFDSACLDLSKAGELGLEIAYDAIKKLCK